jgi:hypothetical protein
LVWKVVFLTGWVYRVNYQLSKNAEMILGQRRRTVGGDGYTLRCTNQEASFTQAEWVVCDGRTGNL